jgi:predicted nucleic acid-binding protein
MIVADASAILEILLNGEAAPAIRKRLFAESETIHSPHIIDLEVLQVLRRYHQAKTLNKLRASEALQDYIDIPLQRYPHHVLMPRIWALRENFTAYDGAYVALAEALNAPLLTRDRAFVSPTHRARVLIF